MGLSSSGDYFTAIYTPEKVELDKSDDFNGLEDGKSFGRTSDAGDTWAVLTNKTPGEPNDGTVPVAGSLVINEFMSSNDTTYIPDDNFEQALIDLGYDDILDNYVLTASIEELQQTEGVSRTMAEKIYKELH